MAEFQKVMEQYDRMCKRSNNCYECPITKAHSNTFSNCIAFMRERRKTAEEVIMKWSKENPVVTNAMKFKEIFGYDFQDAFGALGCSEWLDDEYERGKQYE